MGSKEDINDDPYTSDCSKPTSPDNTHAYSQFTIIDGELTEKDCIIKPAGEFYKALFDFEYTGNEGSKLILYTHTFLMGNINVDDIDVGDVDVGKG